MVDYATFGLTAATIFLVGITAGYFGSFHRKRREAALFERQIDAHFELSRQQYQLQLEATRESQARLKQEEAYAKLGNWINMLERTVDEVWFGCASKDAQTEKQARKIVSMWPWETLRIPVDVSPVELYWSSSTRRTIRKFRHLQISRWKRW